MFFPNLNSPDGQGVRLHPVDGTGPPLRRQGGLHRGGGGEGHRAQGGDAGAGKRREGKCLIWNLIGIFKKKMLEIYSFFSFSFQFANVKFVSVGGKYMQVIRHWNRYSHNFVLKQIYFFKKTYIGVQVRPGGGRAAEAGAERRGEKG